MLDSLRVLAATEGGGGLAIFLAIVIILVGGLITVYAIRLLLCWFRCRCSGAKIPLLRLCSMCLRRVSPFKTARAYVTLEANGTNVPLDRLETHSLAGGKLEPVVRALVVAKNAHIDLDFDQAAALDLAGEDVVESVRSSLRQLNAKASPGMCDPIGETEGSSPSQPETEDSKC